MKNISITYSTKDWIIVILRVIIGLLFVFSGVVKLIPIEPFELKFIELGVANWTIAPYLARFVIGGEVFLGLMLILNIKPRLTAITTLAVLILFTLYLLFDIIKNGNDGNCGCFGTFIVMTPLESIVKNLAMIPVVLFILFMNKRSFDYKTTMFITLLLTASLSMPFIIYPLDDPESHLNANSENIGYTFPVELIPDFSLNGKKVDLSKGEHIVGFMSAKCLHCKKAAYKLHILSRQNQLPPIYLVLMGSDEDIPTFVKETKADFPYYIYNKDEFFKISGNAIPRVFYLREGIVKAKFDVTFTEDQLLNVLKK
jgi:uncharacterized membrane protein YphA (DoxX/SURF4 family)